MTNDYRALCGELLEWADRTSSHYYKQADVIVRARALLDQPEPADGEWRTGLPPFAGFYYVRELLNQSIGGDNRAVYVNPEHFVWGFSEWDDPEWIGLNSDITPGNIQWKPANSAPWPVPVSERPPGPEDCDAEGRCWWFDNDDYKWCLESPYMGTRLLCWTHWLPSNALPTPEAP